MFDNIGDKIKSIAKTLFLIEVVLLVVFFIFRFFEIDGIDEFFALVVGIVLGIGGAYLGVVFLYGFGELVENSSIVAYALTDEEEEEDEDDEDEKNTYNKSNTNEVNSVEKVLGEVYRTGKANSTDEKIKCKACNLSISHLPCPYCGYDE